jgi:hypothetical protein
MAVMGMKRNRNRRSLTAWSRAFIVGYALFLALGLPFICWGALADPSHPHGGPHFVFADPPAHHADAVAAVRAPKLQLLLSSDCGSGRIGFNPPEELAAALGLTSATDAPRPAAQSLPDSLTALLMLAVVATAVYFVRLLATSRPMIALPPVAELRLPVPTPPPRAGMPVTSCSG